METKKVELFGWPKVTGIQSFFIALRTKEEFRMPFGRLMLGMVMWLVVRKHYRR